MRRVPSAFCRAALMLAVLVLGTGWAPAAQPGGITVRGRVTNGTPGSSVPVGLPVTLHVFSEMEMVGLYETALSAGGSFQFTGLALAQGEQVVARVVYEDVAYFSDVVTVESGQQSLSLPVTIYETTEEAASHSASLSIDRVHIVMSRVKGRLQVGEYCLVSNEGDRTWVGVWDPGAGERATLPFTLPAGAENLRFDGPGLGERFLERAGGFADTRPVPPGAATVEVFFRYDLPFRDSLIVQRVFDLPVASVVLVIPEDHGAVEGSVTPAGPLDTTQGPALSYTAGPLAAGEALAFSVLARPVVPSATAGLETAVGVLSLAVAIVVAYFLLRRPVPGTLPPRARPLVEAIVALDRRFEVGELSDDAYLRKRESLKAHLRAQLCVQVGND